MTCHKLHYLLITNFNIKNMFFMTQRWKTSKSFIIYYVPQENPKNLTFR